MLSKDQAAQALQEIELAQQRTHAMQRYRDTAPFFVVWGGVWFIANTLTGLQLCARYAWPVLTLGGIVVSFLIAMRTRQRYQFTSMANHYSWRFGLLWLVVLGYFIANFALLPAMTGIQRNAYISLFWAFIYTFMGVWAGWRIFTIGLLIAAATLVGYFLLNANYFIWMGLVTGSLLILGGLWLRKV